MGKFSRTLYNKDGQYAYYFLILKFIKLKFSMHNFNCKMHFDHMQNVSGEDMNSLPKAWHVQYCYYKGRYLMYTNNFAHARVELRRAFELALNRP